MKKSIDLLLQLGRFALVLKCIVHRNLVARFFNTIKQVSAYRHRYDKFAANCLAMASWQLPE